MIQVYEADYEGEVVAVKVTRACVAAKKALLRERDALRICQHDNIVHLKHVSADGRALVLELCRGGTLEEWLANVRGKRSKSRGKSRRQVMPVRRILQVAVELMRAISCMHTNGLCHGDIKSGNILLSSTSITPQSAGVRLADMGFCRQVGSDISPEDGGSTPFIPRELQHSEDTTALPAHDVYAAGVVLLDLVCTSKPYEELTVRMFEEALEECTLYSRNSVPLAEFKHAAADEFMDLIFEMVSHSRDARPTAAEAVSRLEAIISVMDKEKMTMRSTRRRPATGADDAASGCIVSISTASETVHPVDPQSADLPSAKLLRGEMLPSAESGLVEPGLLSAVDIPCLDERATDDDWAVSALDTMPGLPCKGVERDDREKFGQGTVAAAIIAAHDEHVNTVLGLEPGEQVDEHAEVNESQRRQPSHNFGEGTVNCGSLTQTSLPALKCSVSAGGQREPYEECGKPIESSAPIPHYGEGITVSSVQTAAPAEMSMSSLHPAQADMEFSSLPWMPLARSDTMPAIGNCTWRWTSIKDVLGGFVAKTGCSGCCCCWATGERLTAGVLSTVPAEWEPDDLEELGGLSRLNPISDSIVSPPSSGGIVSDGHAIVRASQAKKGYRRDAVPDASWSMW